MRLVVGVAGAIILTPVSPHTNVDGSSEREATSDLKQLSSLLTSLFQLAEDMENIGYKARIPLNLCQKSNWSILHHSVGLHRLVAGDECKY